MTLIESMMVDCVRLVKTSTEDDYLGHDNDWQPDGETFRAAIIRQQPSDGTEAEKPTFHDEYTIVVYAGTALHHYDVFKRVSDDAVFRVTGDTRDTEAPAMSSVQIAKTTAERWIPE